MCDAATFAKAGTDVLNGIAGAIDARSRARFEAAQLEAQSFIIGANASIRTTGLRKDFIEQQSVNNAAIAITGLSASSFENVQQGNRDDLRLNSKSVLDGARTARTDIRRQQKETLLEGSIASKASLFAGFHKAVIGLAAGEASFQKSKSPKNGLTRKDFFKNSFFK